MIGTGTITGRILGADSTGAATGFGLSPVDSECAGISNAEMSILYNGLPTLTCVSKNNSACVCMCVCVYVCV